MMEDAVYIGIKSRLHPYTELGSTRAAVLAGAADLQGSHSTANDCPPSGTFYRTHNRQPRSLH